MTHIPEKEVLRYLGTQRADAALHSQIAQLCAAMEEHIVPKSVWREYPCTVLEHAVRIPGACFESRRLSLHLRGCEALLLFAATLGTEADRLERMERTRSLTRGAVIHAAGAAMIEQYCDDVQMELALSYETRGLFLRPRYSPGYGDLSLSCQADFFRLLELPKKLALTLSDENLMRPSKSITAVIGLCPQRERSFARFQVGRAASSQEESL